MVSGRRRAMPHDESPVTNHQLPITSEFLALSNIGYNRREIHNILSTQGVFFV
jgi:hypothetical protein